ACPEGEEHEGGLLATALDLRLSGERTIILGANTPAAALGAAVKKTKARAAGLSLVNPRSTRELRRVLEEAASACSPVPVVVGGVAARR
ncbi:cobalamin-dependent protein, partial [Klebsiella pneumoniae]